MPIDVEGRVHELVADPDRRRVLAAACRERLARTDLGEDLATAHDLVWTTFLALCPELVLTQGEAFTAIPAFVQDDLRGEVGLMLVIPTLWARRSAPGADIQWTWRRRDGHIVDVRRPEHFFRQRVAWAALDDRRRADRFAAPPIGADGTSLAIDTLIDAHAVTRDPPATHDAFALAQARACRERFYREFVPRVRDLRFATPNGRPEFEYTVCELASRNVLLPEGCPPRTYPDFEPGGTLRVGGQKVLATRTRTLSLEIHASPLPAPIACTLDTERGAIAVRTGPAHLGAVASALESQLAGIVRSATASDPRAAVAPLAPTLISAPHDRQTPCPLPAGGDRQTLALTRKGLALSITVTAGTTELTSSFELSRGLVALRAATDPTGAARTTWGQVQTTLSAGFAGLIATAETPRPEVAVVPIDAAPLDESEAARNQRQSRTRQRLLEALGDPAFMRAERPHASDRRDAHDSGPCLDLFAHIVDRELCA